MLRLPLMFTRRLFLLPAFLLFTSCQIFNQSSGPTISGKLTIGIVAYDEGARSLEQYTQLSEHLGAQLKTQIELEPAYNEVKALSEIKLKHWAVVFAPPGLSAIAVNQANYIPLFPLRGANNLRSVLVVQDQSPITKLADLSGKGVALGQVGSATGYYLPLYDLYGLTLAEVRLAPTPQTALQWVANGEVAAAALSKDQLDRNRSQFPANVFRILHTSRPLPLGSVLVSPDLEPTQRQLLEQALNDVSPALAEQAGYIPNTKPPDYKILNGFIEKVKPIEARIREKPAPLLKP
jgi:phosphonate transport system substrate-binding protein